MLVPFRLGVEQVHDIFILGMDNFILGGGLGNYQMKFLHSKSIEKIHVQPEPKVKLHKLKVKNKILHKHKTENYRAKKFPTII